MGFDAKLNLLFFMIKPLGCWLVFPFSFLIWSHIISRLGRTEKSLTCMGISGFLFQFSMDVWMDGNYWHVWIVCAMGMDNESFFSLLSLPPARRYVAEIHDKF